MPTDTAKTIIKKKRTVLKNMRQIEKRHLHNKSLKSAMKTQIKKFRKLVEAGNVEAAKKELPKTISTLDKIAQKGLVHENNINRNKSRLYRILNNLIQSQKEPAK